ncbi:MAG: Eco47II family restriction endonuclease [Gemmatimonadetes bacterium]|nr:Eco47II family restriction endonuclease [Gemmatimonadota bacterium]
MLAWISDEKLSEEIVRLQQRTRRAWEYAEERRVRNVIDPFLSLVIASVFGIQDPKELVNIQNAESALRGLSNALGDFHQRILGNVDDWENHDAGYDLECSTRRIVAEVKNKWNTMNAPNRRQVEMDLGTAIRQKLGTWTGYLVFVIPRRPERYTKPIPIERNLFEIDGASFYELVTGDPNAIHDLLDKLCDVIMPSNHIAKYCRQIMMDSLPPRIKGQH